MGQPPNDSVSSLSFSPKANFLVATSWDSQVCLISVWLLRKFLYIYINIMPFYFVWTSTLLSSYVCLKHLCCVGSMLGDNPWWDKSCQYAQGINIAWPAGNNGVFVLTIFTTCISYYVFFFNNGALRFVAQDWIIIIIILCLVD